MSSQIEEVKSRIDIVDLVGSYLKLQKAGVNFKARCPFHNERTPSFFVTPSRQIWHCFGCQKGGDAFKFVMEIEGCEFREALTNLAQRAGVELKKEIPGVRDERERQLEILEEATKFFENRLADDALMYLKNRGLEETTIKEFRLGYAPDEWRGLLNHLSFRGFKEADIEKVGLIIKGASVQGQGARYYDRFRGRIIFPIFNQGGKVIAFGGRIFPEKSDNAKYMNSPETMLYQKSRILYGLHKSKIEILRENSCVLVEGYMDFLSVYQAGTKNVVASSGTALTEDHLKILRRFCEKITAAFDMDEAGEAASQRGIELALKAGFDVRVLKFKDGFKDPADVLLKDKNSWLLCLQNSRHIVQFYIDSVLNKFSIGSPELSREIQKKVLPAVSNLFSDLEQAHWVREIAQLLNIKEEAVWTAVQKITNSNPPAGGQIPNNTQIPNIEKSKTRKELLENKIMGIVAKHPEFLEDKSLFPDVSVYKNTEAESRFILEAEMFLHSIGDAKLELKKCIVELKKEQMKEKINILSQRINFAEKNKNDNLSELLTEFKNISEQIKKI